MGWNPFRRPAAPAATIERARQEPRFNLPRSSPALRSFNAATVDLLTADLPAVIQSGNAALRPALRILRSRSRQLAENNDYAREFLRLLSRKVLGPDGIKLVVRAMRDKTTVDEADSTYLETSFAEWSKKGTCTVCGLHSWADVERLALTSMARDGECLIRLVKGFDGNRFRFALQMIEADALDENLNVARGAGFGGVTMAANSEIRMGVERNPWGRPVAYQILTRHPGDDLGIWTGNVRYTRVPAEEMIHLFVPDRIGDARGAPWIWTAIRRLQMIGGYEEAELVASRLAASKGGFFTEPTGDEMDAVASGTDAQGNLIEEAVPGTYTRLPKGVEFTPFDPQHPGANYAGFIKATLRGACAGMGVAYHSVSKDLSDVNFSSIRQGELDDREQFRMIQRFLIQGLSEQVWDAWLDMGLLSGALALPPAKRDKFDAANWHPRGWPWVDPTKDIAAEAEAVALGIRSRTQICAERGIDFEDVLRERKREQDLAKQYGVTLSDGTIPSPGAAAVVQPESESTP